MLHCKTPVFLAWGPELSFLYNDAYLDILGERHPAALGRPLYEVWAEIRAEIEPLVNQALSGEPVYLEDAVFTLRRKGAHAQAWFSVAYAPVDGPDGRVAGLYCNLTETTAKVLAEKNLQAQTRRFYSLLEPAPSFMAVVREPGHVHELANSAYLRLAGRQDLIGKPVRDVFQEIQGQDYLALLDQVYATGQPFIGNRMPVIFSRQVDGPPEQRIVDFIFQPITAADGVVTGIFIEGNDVTEQVRTEDARRFNPASRQFWGDHQASESLAGYGERKGWWADGPASHGRPLEAHEWAMARALQGEEALRETVNQYRTIANAIPQIVWASRPDGYHDYFNQQWHEYTGVPQDSTFGEEWKKLFQIEDQIQASKKWRHSLATGEPYEVEYRLRHHSGQYRWNLGRALPVRNAQGAIVRWMGTCTDIHEQKLAQEGLLQADRLKDEFLAMLAHELRNPLAPIATAAHLLSTGMLEPEGLSQLSEVISRQIGHMTRLIDDLLDVSRVTWGQVTLDKHPLDMNSIVTEAVEQVRPLLQAKAQHLDIQLSPGRSLVSGDRMRLVQVLANVLNNAVKYTPDAGRIALRVVEDASHLTVCVRDNGIGMSPELAAIAFELFTQGERTSDRTQGGLGIGLALVQSLVHLHGGTVRLHSEGAGLGSELTMVLPRLPQDEGPRRFDAANALALPARESLRVMVVDDNVDAARLLGMFVELLGHEVFVQFHPVSAIECAQQVQPHICLLDIGLPDMDGYALARQLHRIPGMENTVLAAVTGYSQPRDKQAAVAAGFNFHFAKPISAQQLESWLADVSTQAQSRAMPAATKG